MGLAIGVDIGGTFTDLIAVDPERGSARIVKVPTTPEDQSLGLMNAIERLGVDLAEVEVIVHGTTVATNALIEGKGAATALLATAGFRDVIELRNRHRPQMYGLRGEFEPLSPRQLRFGVAERLTADGEVLTPLDEEDVRTAVLEAREAGAECLAISFLHSYRSDRHEQRAAEIVRSVWPDAFVSLSSKILPEVREFERSSTTVANAYLQPTMAGYLGRLLARLGEAGYEGEVLVVQSNGGVAAALEAAELPVNTMLSGPAAGVAAAQAVGAEVGATDLLTLDMGGTSVDVSVILNGNPRLARQAEVRYGVPIRGQMIEILTAGAGGGSIARLDERGILTVGPESAGADPGPACYGRGGELPTVTDAQLVLGRIDATAALGETDALQLRRELAAEAIQRHVAEPLGLDVTGAAASIITVVNDKMAGYLRRITVARGLDPRTMSLVAFGGAGPLHAAALLRAAEMAAVIVPPLPGVLSAQGCVSADFRHDYVKAVGGPLDALSEERLAAIVEEHRQRGEEMLDLEGVAIGERELELRADLAFHGQTHSLLVKLETDDLRPEVIGERFLAAYRRRYGRVLETAIELVNLRTTVVGKRSLAVPPPRLADAPAGESRREIWFAGEWHDSPVHRREALRPGETLTGPAVIEQLDTTVLVEPGIDASLRDGGALILEPVQ